LAFFRIYDISFLLPVPSTTDFESIYGRYDNSYEKNHQGIQRLIYNVAKSTILNVKHLPAKRYDFDRTFTDG